MSLIGLVERVGHEWEIARQNPVTDVRTWGKQPQCFRAGLKGYDVLKRREPDGFCKLRTQKQRDLRPDVIGVAHLISLIEDS